MYQLNIYLIHLCYSRETKEHITLTTVEGKRTYETYDPHSLRSREREHMIRPTIEVQRALSIVF